MPTDIQLMIDAAVRESNRRGHDAVAVKDDEKKISNVYLCFAILELFDNDLDFFLDDVDEALNTNPFDLMFEAVDATGKKLTEEDETFVCCICGEEEKGYGNNPEPFKHKGRCCDACNIKFVIPARLAAIKSDEE